MTTQTGAVLQPISAFILAGGLSTRMGRDKALLRLGGVPVVRTLVLRAARVASPVVVVVDQHEKLDGLVSRHTEILEDVIPRCGPLGGIDAGLARTTTDWNLFLTCDMPLVTTRLLRRLVQNAEARLDALHFQVAGEPRPHPFPLLLHRRVAKRLRRRIRTRQLSVLALLDALEVGLVDAGTRAGRDALVNVNSPADWRRVCRGSRHRGAS